MTLAFATPKTENHKITAEYRKRPVTITYAGHASCPDSCAFKDDGCYGQSGPMAWAVTNRLNTEYGTKFSPFASAIAAIEEAKSIDALTTHYDMRLHGVGDCGTNAAARMVARAVERYQDRAVAAGHKRPSVWTYTHAWRVVERESWGTVSVLASCETAADVALATARGYATELTVRSLEEVPELPTRALPCPQQSGKAADCASCMLCARDTVLRGRSSIILTTHGAKHKSAEAAIRSRNNG